MYIVDINEKFMSKAVQTVKWPQQQNIFYYFVALNQISLIYISVLHISLFCLQPFQDTIGTAVYPHAVSDDDTYGHITEEELVTENDDSSELIPMSTSESRSLDESEDRTIESVTESLSSGK
jgi:hypothetical protein